MRIRLATLGLGAAIGLSLAACGTDSGQQADRPQAAAAQTAGIKIGPSSLGPILTDSSGRTLYAFVNDKNGTSTCAGGCIATWPALTSSKAAIAEAGVNTALLSHIVRVEGSDQVTYGNWPLYYYVGDQGPGDVDGQGVDGVWFVVGADGKLIKTAV